jgi:hypothetical protein
VGGENSGETRFGLCGSALQPRSASATVNQEWRSIGAKFLFTWNEIN